MNKISRWSIGRDNAINLSKSMFYENLSDDEIFQFQVSIKELCMPFEVFHRAAESALGRSVWTHEFADMEKLKKSIWLKLIRVKTTHEMTLDTKQRMK